MKLKNLVKAKQEFPNKYTFKKTSHLNWGSDFPQPLVLLLMCPSQQPWSCSPIQEDRSSLKSVMLYMGTRIHLRGSS